MRIAPYHSWGNPAENYVNSGLQLVGIMQKETETFKELLKNCNNLSAIRSLGEKQPRLAEEVKDAL